MLDEYAELRQYLLSSSDLPETQTGRLRHDTICDDLSGLNRALVILARGFLRGRTDSTSLHAARRYLESWYGYTRREYFLFEDGAWKSVRWNAWCKVEEGRTASVLLMPSRCLYLRYPADLSDDAARESLLAQRREDFAPDLSVPDADRAEIASVQGILPDYLCRRVLQSKYDDLLRQLERKTDLCCDLAAVQQWYDAVQADLRRRFAQEKTGRLPSEQYRLAHQPLSALFSDAAFDALKNDISPVQRAVNAARLLSERGWSFARPEMHVYAERKNDFNRILLDRVLSAALLAGPLQRNWLVAVKSAADDTMFTLAGQIYTGGKQDRVITDEKNRYRDAQVRQVLKLTAAVLLARREAGRDTGSVLLNRASLSNWLCATMGEKSRSKPSPLRKYYWDEPKKLQPLFPETAPSSGMTLNDLLPAWEERWDWRVCTEAELIAAVQAGQVPEEALCFTDEAAVFAPEQMISARAGEIAAQEGENPYEAEF